MTIQRKIAALLCLFDDAGPIAALHAEKDVRGREEAPCE